MLSPLKTTLLTGYKNDMISFLHEHPDTIEEAFDLALSDESPFFWRATWVLFSVLPNNDSRLIEKQGDFIAAFPHKKDGHQREILKLLGKITVQEQFEGLLIDLCMKTWMDVKKCPSCRYTAWVSVAKMTQKYPELSIELKSVSDWYYLKTLSPGIRNGLEKKLNGLIPSG